MSDGIDISQETNLKGFIQKLTNEIRDHRNAVATLEKHLNYSQEEINRIEQDKDTWNAKFKLENNNTIISKISTEVEHLKSKEEDFKNRITEISDEILKYNDIIEYKGQRLKLAQDNLGYLEEVFESISSEDVLDRIKEGIGAKADGEVAEALGVSKQAVYNARANNRVPDSWVRSIAVKYPGISTDWLFFGRKTKVSLRMALDRLGAMEDYSQGQACSGEEIILVPMVEARLSAGSGSFEASDDIKDRCPFQASFLHRKGNASQMVVMAVSGDSMSPTIEDGDTVLIDQSQIEPVPGKIFAVSVEGMIYLKRVNAKPGQLIMASDNEAYEPLLVDTRGDLADTVRIIGRAVWWAREA